ncbi:MAG TPA: histidinol-phosphate transaminase, partial [Gemmatimonadaceae bacterium]
EAMTAHGVTPPRGSPSGIRLDSNENPNGPGRAVLDAVHAAFDVVNRYPGGPSAALAQTVAKSRGVAVESVILGCGSTEILHLAVRAFTSPAKPLVVASPTFEDPGHVAQAIGSGVVSVPVTGALKLDLAAMADAARGAGLVYLCNPNNPTATVHGAAAVNDFIRTVGSTSPDTTILVDEAYHEFVEDPSYATAIPAAMENARVIVARTFSKIYGLAGLRIGYALARPETIKAMALFKIVNSTNMLAVAGAMAAIDDQAHIDRERRLNHDAKVFTHRFFENAGYRVVPSDANFLMVDIRRDSAKFQEDCRARGVLVGRPFPPLTTYARVSIGTADEMRQATEIFKRVLVTA